jgi:hypothetical protein
MPEVLPVRLCKRANLTHTNILIYRMMDFHDLHGTVNGELGYMFSHLIFYLSFLLSDLHLFRKRGAKNDLQFSAFVMGSTSYTLRTYL